MTKPTLPSSSSSSSSTQSSSEKVPTEPQQAQAQAVPTVAPAAGTGESTSTNSSSAVEATASATAATATAAVPASEGSSEAKREDEPTVRLGRSSWDERDDKSREGAAAHLFSPPPYKTNTFATPHQDQPPSQGANRNMDFEHGDERDFDQLDLNVLTGPEDPLMIGGSFAEDSPERLTEDTENKSPDLERLPSSEPKKHGHSRRSPPGHPYGYHQQQVYPGSQYRRSPPTGRDAYRGTPHSRGPPPPPGYYPGYPPPGGSPTYGGPRASPYAGYSPYHHYYPEQYWGDRSQGHGQYPYELEEDIPPPPPSSTKKARDVDHPSSPSRAQLGTPDNPSRSRQSPFRSPPQSAGKQKYRRSPFMSSSPGIGTHGSFGLDTPSAMLAPQDFSPMGPSFQDFGDESTLALGSELDMAQHDNETPVFRRRAKDEQSPLSGLLKGLSPMDSLHGIARSPVADRDYNDPASHERKARIRFSDSKREQRMHSTPHGSVKKALWPRSEGPASETPGRVRIEIGSTGSLSTKKSLDGINSLMHVHSRDGTPSSRDSKGGSHSRPPSRGHHYHMQPYRAEMATPIKSSGHPHRQRATPSSARHPHYSAYRSAPPSAHKDYPGSASKPMYGPPSSVPPPSGKENKKKAASPKRSPCNCKKSKCLKLYCECFAAQRFCSDCNCLDCLNTPTAGKVRDKAIKDTRAKNPNAFKSRFGGKSTVATESSHNMGCRCKRSECLKKYCECFQAGVLCGAKCKCSDCLNYRGSQALIDKRRKIKDQRGADFAMRVADEAWKQGRGPTPSRKPVAPAAAAQSRRPLSKSPAHGHMPPPHMLHPSPRGPPPTHPGHRGHPGAHPYHMPPYMHAPPPGYPHMAIPMTPAGYPHPPPHMMPGESPHMYPPPHSHPGSSSRKGVKRSHHHVTPVASTPRTPGVRVKFDPASSRKKRKISPGQNEATLPFFGNKFPEQPKTTALAIFSFLSNDDLYNAGLVCKSWSQLAMDGELWKFEA